MPEPVTGDWIARDFVFHTGEKLPELRLHYTTLGKPDGNNAVLILHGTTGQGGRFLGYDFGGVLFGPGQPLDAARYYIILPDAIGHGQSSKPSDGLHVSFPITITTTWCAHNTSWCMRAWGSITCAW